jgi:hypothetical protein
MNLHEMPGRTERDGTNTTSAVFGEHYEMADGSIAIPVTKPVGVFVVKDGKPVWEPAVDATRIAMLGILVGLASATLAGIAMVRRPPWPELHGDVSKRK